MVLLLELRGLLLLLVMLLILHFCENISGGDFGSVLGLFGLIVGLLMTGKAQEFS